MEQNKEKRMKRDEDSLFISFLFCTNIQIIGVPEEKEKRERTWENIWRDYSRKFPNLKGNSQPSPGGTESLMKDKPKKEHTETHINQTNKN